MPISSPYPYTLTNGTTADASQVMADFLQIQNDVNSNAAPLGSPAFTGIPTAPTAAPGTNTTQIATTAFVIAQIPAPTYVNRESFETGAVATGTTVMPFGDIIPQSNQGDQYLSVTITPQNVANILTINITIFIAVGAPTSGHITAALFQDSIAGALAMGSIIDTSNNHLFIITFSHEMVAGTTSPTTFKVRAGADAAGTTTLNGELGARIGGGVMSSFIEVIETTT